MNTWTLVAVIAVLAAGTYVIRLAGPLLREKLVLPDVVKRMLPLGAVALLAALAASAALTDGDGFAGVARPVGVLAGVFAAWLRAPFVAVVAIAAATAAGLRLLGVE